MQHVSKRKERLLQVSGELAEYMQESMAGRRVHTRSVEAAVYVSIAGRRVITGGMNGGSGLCEHSSGRVAARVQGSDLCEHGRRKSRCKDVEAAVYVSMWEEELLQGQWSSGPMSTYGRSTARSAEASLYVSM
jgi:hypothetical protein